MVLLFEFTVSLCGSIGQILSGDNFLWHYKKRRKLQWRNDIDDKPHRVPSPLPVDVFRSQANL